MDVETEKTLFTLSLLSAYGFSEKAQPIGWRRVMITCPIFGDDVLEERVISLFRRLGHDGRGVTLTSLQTYTGVLGTRLRALLASLVQRGKLAPAGCDPLASDFAFRLSLSAKNVRSTSIAA